MSKSRVMSRQMFMDGVEKLLGRFDSDSFMRGFQAGREQMITEVVAMIGDSETLEFTRLNVINRVRKLISAHRRKRRTA